jgi:hypothetical protein
MKDPKPTEKLVLDPKKIHSGSKTLVISLKHPCLPQHAFMILFSRNKLSLTLQDQIKRSMHNNNEQEYMEVKAAPA